ncbi:MAG: phosphoadenylyl-sulfate reductase [Legionellales bacterium]|nr:MAG: phosphoadenylyl-sulfate reductase [Legionellales bacterium]
MIELNTQHKNLEPHQILQTTLEMFPKATLAFSGSEDVVLIDMAHKLKLKPAVFVLDTGRLHPKTYQYIERIREHYQIDITMTFPDANAVEDLVKRKGLFSFYQDGHSECCKIRKVHPLQRILEQYPAWITGMRQDQSTTRTEIEIFATDPVFATENHELYKINPLLNWTSKDIWDYITANNVPYNQLHQEGYISIGCAPCTRAIAPNQHERTGRWWWENPDKKECGLHR